MKRININTLRDSAGIIIIASVIGFTVNIIHPHGFILLSKRILENSKIISISVEEARIKHGSQQVLFIDAREETDYQRSHISGAINIPATAPLGIHDGNNHDSLFSKPVELVIYCDGPSCDASEILSQRIIESGYHRHLYQLKEGFSQWLEMGLPVAAEKEGS